MTDPFVSTMRRYVVDYTNTGDTALIDEIMAPEYQITIAGDRLDRDAYRSMVEGAYRHFPDLQLVVHDLFTNGERLALRFTEHATAPGLGAGRASWSGISLYRRDADYRLTECLVEQDFYGRRTQLAAGVDDPVDDPMADPWSATPGEPSEYAERTFRRWVASGLQGASEGRIVDDAPHRSRTPVLTNADWTIDDMFSAGHRVAARLTGHGGYAGGLFGVSNALIGSPIELAATCVAHTDHSAVSWAWLVTDRFGLQQRLKHA